MVESAKPVNERTFIVENDGLVFEAWVMGGDGGHFSDGEMSGEDNTGSAQSAEKGDGVAVDSVCQERDVTCHTGLPFLKGKKYPHAGNGDGSAAGMFPECGEVENIGELAVGISSVQGE